VGRFLPKILVEPQHLDKCPLSGETVNFVASLKESFLEWLSIRLGEVGSYRVAY